MGVHQDGLVHISALADCFVKDPHEIVKTGDLVKVKVMAVDKPRRRIALTMRLGDQPGARTSIHEPLPRSDPRSDRDARGRKPLREPVRDQAPAPGGAMATAFSQARDTVKRR